jgi:hypothetical protein
LNGLQGFIAGVGTTSLAFYIYDYIAGYFEYSKFKQWLASIDVDVRTIDEASFDEYFAIWELSKLPGVEISNLTEGNSIDVNSKED